MRVKICGITNLEDAMLAADLGADALGFIFYEQSKRSVDPKRAAEIISGLPPFIIKTGVFVNETSEIVNSIAAEVGLNLVQLHGDEDLKYIKQIEHPVIKSLRVGENMNWNELEEFKNYPILLDTDTPGNYGGSGKSFKWNNIPKTLANKIVLAGGVSIKNIEKIYTEVKPYAVDVASSLEEYPGKKDQYKMEDFFSLVNKLRN